MGFCVGKKKGEFGVLFGCISVYKYVKYGDPARPNIYLTTCELD